MATPTEPVVTAALPQLAPPVVTAERSAIVSPLGWSAIFAGATVAVGVWLVLHMLGIGIGLTAIDPRDAGTLRGVGIGTGVWSAIAPILALLIGGLVAGRMAPTINTANAAIHGAVVWALTALVSMVLLSMAVSSAVKGAAMAGGRAAEAVAGAQVGDVSLEDLGLSRADLVAGVNRRLAAEGLPPVTPEVMEEAARDAIRGAVRQGRLDRDVMIQALTRNTPMTRAEAERVASMAEQRLRGRLGEVGQQAQRTALHAAEVTGTVLLVLSFVMILGLGAAIGGAIASVRRERREHVVLPRAQTTIRPPGEQAAVKPPGES
jgi:hypothetical protein